MTALAEAMINCNFWATVLSSFWYCIWHLFSKNLPCRLSVLDSWSKSDLYTKKKLCNIHYIFTTALTKTLKNFSYPEASLANIWKKLKKDFFIRWIKLLKSSPSGETFYLICVRNQESRILPRIFNPFLFHIKGSFPESFCL